MGPPLQHGQDAILNRDPAVSVLPPVAVCERDRQHLDFCHSSSLTCCARGAADLAAHILVRIRADRSMQRMPYRLSSKSRYLAEPASSQVSAGFDFA
jgi:hypothetical protein